MNCQKTLANYVLFLVVCIGGSKVSYCDTLPSVLMPVLPHSTPGAKSTSPFKEMQALRALGQVDEAIRVGQVYLSAYPRDADILLLMGLLFYQKEDFTTSGQYLMRALAMSPTYLDAKLALINVYVAQNDLNQAGALISEVVHQAPNDPRVQAIQVSFKTIEDAKRTNPDKGGSLLESVVNSYPSRTAQTPISPQTTGVPSPWHEMRRLRAEGQLDRALEIGKGYLKKQPQDGDVLLQMGLIWAQKKEFTLAVQSLKQVLTLAPNYLDAKLSLITIYIAQNQLQQAASFMMQVKQQAPSDPRVIAIQTLFKRAILENKLAVIRNDYQKGRLEEARILSLQALAQDPANADVRLILGRIYLTQKQYTQAKKEFEYLLQQNQQNKDATLALIDVELAMGHEWQARSLIRQGLRQHPKDPDFLFRDASMYSLRHQYARAVHEDKKIIAENSNNEQAKGLLKEISELNPHYLYGLNSVGFNSEVDYVSDLNTAWQYSSVYYNRDTPWGLASLSLNDATRLGVTSNQGAFNLFPVLSKWLYLRVTGAYANEPILFPTYVGGGEAYFSTQFFEVSGGADYSYILPSISYTRYTGSISKEWKKYWVSFRPNYYLPLYGATSLSYTGVLIRYFGPKDTYAKLSAGTGTTPDLANLTTVDFIVIKNNFVTFNVQFPIRSHKLLLSIGGDYQHWVFPSGRIRNISGMTAGLHYRFQGKS